MMHRGQDIFMSIVVPTYNRGHLIQKTLQSCLDQNTAASFEIIVVDDGSTDNTEIKVAQINDPRIRYYKKANGERGAARNLGVRQASGAFVSFLDSDDIIYPTYVQNAFQYATDRPDSSIFHLAYQIASSSGEVLHTYTDHSGVSLNQRLLKGNFMSCMGVIVRREIVLKQGFSENRALSGSEDWLLWLKLAARHEIHHLPTVSATMIDHDERSTRSFSEQELLDRTILLCTELRDDKIFVNHFGHKAIRHIKAHMYTYSALHLILTREIFAGWGLYWKGIAINPGEIFTRRTLAIIKHSIT
jgi:glycosyltransferase involved in cell wall biosynthesis